MERTIIYTGLFFRKENILGLVPEKYEHKIIENPHITFQYKPDEATIPFNLIGKFYDVKILGWGKSEKAIALKSEIPEELKEYYQGQECVHITTSVSEIGCPVDAGSITDWRLFEKPVNILGRFDVFTV